MIPLSPIELTTNLVLSLSLLFAPFAATVVKKKPAAKKPKSPKKAAAGKKEKKPKVCIEL